ncbi:GNAT family N-acetyltransferase [Kiritimatiellota bacterium B12222]|nr:GNAT family N-acetyltransferase [Kiritimatiellota bacterium B12222]
MLTRVSQPAEIETIARLAREIWTSHYTPIIGAEQVDYMLERFQSVPAIQQQLAQGMIYGLMSSDAGYVGYEPKADHVFLSKIYVHPDHRKQGWARKALDWICQNENPERIRLTVNRHNTASISAYKKLGFRKTGTLVSDIGNGYVMDDFVMEWP